MTPLEQCRQKFELDCALLRARPDAYILPFPLPRWSQVIWHHEREGVFISTPTVCAMGYYVADDAAPPELQFLQSIPRPETGPRRFYIFQAAGDLAQLSTLGPLAGLDPTDRVLWQRGSKSARLRSHQLDELLKHFT